jgi:hypothetical protein
MIAGFIILFFSATHTTTSTPISYYTLANPAFTAHYGTFHVFIEPKDIGDISVFSCSGKHEIWGFALSNMRTGDQPWHERRNWASVALHLNSLPLSVGINAGLNKVNEETNILTDFGVWLKKPLHAGFTYSNIFHDDRILRGGVSYTWSYFTGSFEIEDSIRSGALKPHGLVKFSYPIGDFTFAISGGIYPDILSTGLGVEYRRFITAQLFYQDIANDNLKALIGIHFRPPVVVREVAVVETMTVTKPVIVERPVSKTHPPPPPKTTPELTAEQQAYCEEHYMKGIEYYVKDRLDAAIKEWILVTNIDPEYKDVKRYLENARAKKDLLKED